MTGSRSAQSAMQRRAVAAMSWNRDANDEERRDQGARLTLW